MKHSILILLSLAFSVSCLAKEHRTILKKGSNIYIESKNAAEKVHLEKTLEYRGTYNIVDKPDKADYIVKVVSKGDVNYRAFAQIIDPRTNKVLQTTPKVNTFWSVTFNYKLKAMKKLARKRLRCTKTTSS